MRQSRQTSTAAMLAAVVAVVLTANLATPAAAKVSTDHDETVDMTAYRTYAWTEGTPANELAQRRIQRVVDGLLAEKGFLLVEENPDFLVATHARAEQQQIVDVDHHGRYGARWGGWGTTTVNVREIAVGTLVLDVIEAAGQNLVWRAIATDTLADKTSKNEAKFRKKLAKALKKFPPPPPEREPGETIKVR